MANEKRLLIYFDELVMKLCKAYGTTMDTHIYSPRDILDHMQGIHPVDAVEVVHGRWEDVSLRFTQVKEKCSVCGGIVYAHGFNYCPNCGAKMDGDGNA